MGLCENKQLNINFKPAVFYALTSGVGVEEVYPKARQEEIDGCKNIPLRLSKYCAWKLLEIAVNEYIGLDFNKLSFKKSPFGKWECEEFYFSISHSGDLVSVCISPNMVGVDCQEVKPLKSGLEDKILTLKEMKIFNSLTAEEKEKFLLCVWCKKECLLKLCGEGTLNPSQRETQDKEFLKSLLFINNKEYLLFACGKGIDQNTLIKEIEL